MIELKYLQYFSVAAESKSFSEAAEKLYTTQPNISMTIRALEDELHMQLFHRGARGISLTDNGKLVYQYVLNVLKNIDMMSTLQNEQGKKVFSIITTPSSNMSVLFSRFYDLHRGENNMYKYMEGSTEQIIEMVECHDAQMGFVFTSASDRTAFFNLLDRKHLVFHPLLSTDIVLYAGKKSPVYGKNVLYAEELADLSLVQRQEDYFALDSLVGSLGSLTGKNKNIRLDRTVITNSDHAMIHLLLTTDLCNLGSYWLRDSYRAYDIQRIPIANFASTMQFGYIQRENEILSENAREFLDFVHDVLKKEAPTSN